MYETITRCKLAGDSCACHLKSAQTSCRYFGLFFYKQKDTMKWRFDKQTVLLESLEIASKKQLFTSVFNSASVLAVWHPNPQVSLANLSEYSILKYSIRAPSWRSVWLPARQARSLLIYIRLAHEWERLKAIGLHRICFYLADNILSNWAALMHIHKGSGFETLKQAENAKFNCYAAIHSGTHLSSGLCCQWQSLSVPGESASVTLQWCTPRGAGWDAVWGRVQYSLPVF